MTQGAVLVTPLFVGLAAHGVCIRLGALRNLARPISEHLFGANKTYRGIVCVAAGTAIGFVLIGFAAVTLVAISRRRRNA